MPRSAAAGAQVVPRLSLGQESNIHPGQTGGTTARVGSIKNPPNTSRSRPSTSRPGYQARAIMGYPVPATSRDAPIASAVRPVDTPRIREGWLPPRRIQVQTPAAGKSSRFVGDRPDRDVANKKGEACKSAQIHATEEEASERAPVMGAVPIQEMTQLLIGSQAGALHGEAHADTPSEPIIAQQTPIQSEIAHSGQHAMQVDNMTDIAQVDMPKPNCLNDPVKDVPRLRLEVPLAIWYILSHYARLHYEASVPHWSSSFTRAQSAGRRGCRALLQAPETSPGTAQPGTALTQAH